MLLGLASFSSVPFSSRIASGYFATVSLVQGSSTIFITDAEIFGSIVALQEPGPSISITAIFFAASLSLTQPASSINVSNYNAISPWRPGIVRNKRRREVEPALQQLRQTQPTLGE